MFFLLMLTGRKYHDRSDILRSEQNSRLIVRALEVRRLGHHFFRANVVYMRVYVCNLIRSDSRILSLFSPKERKGQKLNIADRRNRFINTTDTENLRCN